MMKYETYASLHPRPYGIQHTIAHTHESRQHQCCENLLHLQMIRGRLVEVVGSVEEKEGGMEHGTSYHANNPSGCHQSRMYYRQLYR